MSSNPIEQQQEHDEERGDEPEDKEGSEGDVSAEVVHFVLFGGVCISTYPTIFAVLQIFIVIILWTILNALRPRKVQFHNRSLSSFFVLFPFPVCICRSTREHA